ncbi:MAG: asparagine synthase (glutamine-hydrolyzing) [Myxococcales bacterium]|nr:asparagine synthase (glutamine-hydrolyzing) [Myxococcales bacterium]
MTARLARRGPDGEGTLLRRNLALGHRRLAVVDLAHGGQPWESPGGRHALVYNGELYEHAALRRRLIEHPLGTVHFRTRSDTETLLHALVREGVQALSSLRGMFAFAFYDFEHHRLLLARDPLGVKPLYLARVGDEVVFGSHLPALLVHPRLERRLNTHVLGTYLSTLRTTLGRETLYDGVETVLPGEYVEIDARDPALPLVRRRYWQEPELDPRMDFQDAVESTRKVITEAVAVHLEADVPRATFLSGGLDSAIITSVVSGVARCDPSARDLLRTWCAGAGPGSANEDAGPDGDLAHARLVAAHFGADHHDVFMDRDAFADNLDALTAETGLPVSTPNETAILAVSREVRRHATVALTGEGADELYGGYVWPLATGLDSLRPRSGRDERFASDLRRAYGTDDLGGLIPHYLRATGWVPLGSVPTLLRSAEAHWVPDRVTFAIAGEVDDIERGLGPDWQPGGAGRWPDGGPAVDYGPGGDVLLRLHRRINLAGLLGRLDTATMAASLEGRTPFADVRVAESALRIPLAHKLRMPVASDGGPLVAADAVGAGAIGKVVLREAFRGVLPAQTTARPKVSFPLPFIEWLPTIAARLERARVAPEIFDPALWAALRSAPSDHFRWAWPVLSAARWLELNF